MSTQQTNEPGADTQAATQAAATAARKAERERVSNILNCEEAKGREQMAKHLAMETEMSADEAKKLLAVAPKETAEAPKKEAGANPFEKAMDATKNPNVGADAANGSGDDENPVQRILGAQARATGIKQAA